MSSDTGTGTGGGGETTTTSENGCCCSTKTAITVAVVKAVLIVLLAIAIVVKVGVLVVAIAIAIIAVKIVFVAIAVLLAVIAAALLLWMVLVVVPLIRSIPGCTVTLTTPPETSLSDSVDPVVVWDVIDPADPVDHVAVVASTDGGSSFSPVTIDEGETATNLPEGGAFVWESVDEFTPGTVVLLRAIAYDAKDNEQCRSGLQSLQVRS